MKITTAFGVVALVIASLLPSTALAQLIWRWEFGPPVTSGPSDTVTVRATIFNDAASTQNIFHIGLGTLTFASFPGATPGYTLTPKAYLFGIEAVGPVIAPGQSFSFDFGVLTPTSISVLTGAYLVQGSLGVCGGTDGSISEQLDCLIVNTPPRKTATNSFAWRVLQVAPPEVAQQQSRPAQTIQKIPNTLPPPTQITKRNAVVLVHGWNSNPDAWAKQIGAQISAIIDSRTRQGFFANQVWDIIYLDWQGSADTYFPTSAKANTYDLGKKLADILAIGKYSFIHFIAHSAGSNLVEVAAEKLISTAAINAKPVIHETFLDAYAPNHDDELYGLSATFAEHYVTKEPLVPELIRDIVTNASLKHAFNFVVDNLNRPPLATNNCAGIFGPIASATCFHQWPYVWYGITAGDPNNWTYGIHIAKEYSAGSIPSQDDFPKGTSCALTSASTICPSAKTNLRPEIQPIPLTVTNPFSFTNNTSNSTPVTFNKSDTGSVVTALLPVTGIHLTLTTGSPVWVSLGSNMTEGFNTLQFDYRFSTPAEGLLSVFLDDQVVFKADQRDAKAGVNPSGRISVGNVTPGQHTLSFRLDHFTSAQSSVEISNIVPSNVSIIQVVNVKPVANAGQMQKVRLDTLVNLNGTRSFDQDRKPLPLTYDWKQTFGPPALLFDSTTAAPKFTPLTRGLYKFSLVVNDGQSNSNISTVKVHASKNGDLLIEEDNGTGTGCVICNPFSK